jgi:glycosyltransferase involved in cell wall biosynthesis
MRILFTRFPLESAYGGAEVQVLSLMEGLIQHGHEVRFLGSCPTLLKECKRRKIPVTQLTIGPPPVTKWGAVNFLWRKKGMKKLLEQAVDNLPKADAVIMLSLTEKLLLTRIFEYSNIRTFWLEHDRVGRWLTRNPWLQRLRKLSNNATTIVVSELSKKIYVNLGFPEDKVVAIPNGIDPDRFISNPNPNPNPNPNARPHPYYLHIGCISRLTKDKGVDLLIDAVKDIRGINLTIVGSGRDADQIKESIANCQLPIALKSRVEDLCSFYKSTDLLVLPSREHDPFGLVIAEAMMLEVPVGVTDACGIADYLEDGKDAIVVEAASVEKLKEGILKLIDNADLRNSVAKAGFKTAQQQFTVNKMVKRYCKLLEDNKV